jgi:hypothetical protein
MKTLHRATVAVELEASLALLAWPLPMPVILPAAVLDTPAALTVGRMARVACSLWESPAASRAWTIGRFAISSVRRIEVKLARGISKPRLARSIQPLDSNVPHLSGAARFIQQFAQRGMPARISTKCSRRPILLELMRQAVIAKTLRFA